jgi:hypothetical protein
MRRAQLGRAMVAASALVLMTAATPSAVEGASVGEPHGAAITIYQHVNYGGDRLGLSTGNNSQSYASHLFNLNEFSGPCQAIFWDPKTWNDCMSSYKVRNYNPYLYMHWYLYANVNGSMLIEYGTVPPRGSASINVVFRNDAYSSIRLVLNGSSSA